MTDRRAKAESDFKQADKNLQTEEKKAFEQFTEEKDMGIVTDKDIFYQWVYQNAPATVYAHQQRMAAAGYLAQIWHMVGSETAKRAEFLYDPWTVLPGLQTVRRYDQDELWRDRESLRDHETEVREAGLGF